MKKKKKLPFGQIFSSVFLFLLPQSDNLPSLRSPPPSLLSHPSYYFFFFSCDVALSSQRTLYSIFSSRSAGRKHSHHLIFQNISLRETKLRDIGILLMFSTSVCVTSSACAHRSLSLNSQSLARKSGVVQVLSCRMVLTNSFLRQLLFFVSFSRCQNI